VVEGLQEACAGCDGSGVGAVEEVLEVFWCCCPGVGGID